MKITACMVAACLLTASCGDGTTGPCEELPFWSEFQWNVLQTDYCTVSYSVRGDSIYFRAIQHPDTTEYGSDFPDRISVSFFEQIDSLPSDCWERDLSGMGNSGAPESVLDMYEFYYPYGLGTGPKLESIPLQPDDSLGGVNDIQLVFRGLYQGDSTVVSRKLLVTADTQWDLELAPGSTYAVEVQLDWWNPVHFWFQELVVIVL